MELDSCPKCGRSFDGGKGYRLETSVEIPWVYDGVGFWADDPHNGGCGWAWHRFTGKDDYSTNKRNKIQPYLDEYLKKNFTE